jgi:transposase
MAFSAMARYREPNVAQLRFVPINFAELFPEDHPVAQLLATIRKLDLSEFDAGYKNDSSAGGRPADSSERILAVVIYSLLYGGISMRNLQRDLGVRADLLYLSGGMSIDHTTFSVFRKRHHDAILKLFGQTVFLGAQAGLIDLDTVCIDSTKIKAWANRRDIGNREELQRRYHHIQGLCEKRMADWEACEEEEKKKVLLKRVARLARQKTKIATALKFLEEHPERKRLHLHEPDADWQKDGAKGFVLGYSAQLAVDSRSQMIVHADVVTDQADTHQAVSMVQAVEARKVEVCAAKTDEVKYVMDCGYFSGENLKALEERDLFVPDQEYVRRAGGKTKPEDRTGEVGPPPVKEHERRHTEGTLEFVYHADSDSFECPQGGELLFQREKPFHGVSFRSYRKYGCGACPLRTGCIGASKVPTRKDLWIKASDLTGLTVKSVRVYKGGRGGRSPFELAQVMRAKLSTPEGKATYGKRFQVSEGVFAVVKGLRAGHRFLRRRLNRVREEWAERCIAHNMAKMAGFTLCSLMEW